MYMQFSRLIIVLPFCKSNIKFYQHTNSFSLLFTWLKDNSRRKYAYEIEQGKGMRYNLIDMRNSDQRIGYCHWLLTTDIESNQNEILYTYGLTIANIEGLISLFV